MTSPISLYPTLGSLATFVVGWLAVTTALGFMSGWPRLSKHFPDRPDEMLAGFPFSTGTMGMGMYMNGVLNLTACRGGLRVGILRIFGPFSKPFFVAWDQIIVEPNPRPPRQRAMMRLGRPQIGYLEISSGLADRLAQAAGDRWPERTPARN